MKNHTINCYERCISKKFKIPKKLWFHINPIIIEIEYVSKIGRKGIDPKRALSGIFFVLKTGIPWNALPFCFGSSSAVHRAFKKLEALGFFKKLWEAELKIYVEKNSAALSVQSGDCTHIPAPLGQEKIGKSPVNRGKNGSKRSIISDKNGVVIGYALGAGNVHDSKLFEETLLSIPLNIRSYFDLAEMHLDAAYDSQEIKTILFNARYFASINRNKRRSNSSQPACIAKRHFVEASHSWANRFKRLVIRFEKMAKLYSAFANFAFALIAFSKNF